MAIIIATWLRGVGFKRSGGVIHDSEKENSARKSSKQSQQKRNRPLVCFYRVDVMAETKEEKGASIVAAIKEGNIESVRSSLEAGELELNVSVSLIYTLSYVDYH